jgi:hypothetical protein
MSTGVAGLLHYKPMMGAWFGVVSWCLFLALATVQMPWPIAVTATPTVLLLAVLGYLRPRGAVHSCYVDQNGTITLIRRDVRILFNPNYFRCIRMYNGHSSTATYPSMLVLYRDRQPSMWTWLGSVLVPRVTEKRVVLLVNRWWDADGYFVAPRDLAALFYQACVHAGCTPRATFSVVREPGWDARPEMMPL